MNRTMWVVLGVMVGCGEVNPGWRDGVDPAAQDTGLAPAAEDELNLRAVGGGTGGSSGWSRERNCSGFRCTCEGDDACNDMFLSGVCGDVAVCHGDLPVCECLTFARPTTGRTGRTVTGPRGGAVLGR